MATGVLELKDVLQRLSGGDRGAFDVLVRTFWEPLMRYFWKRVPSQDAEELCQNVFVAVYRAARTAASSLPADDSGWSRYLFTCARNQLVDYQRRREVRQAVRRLDDLLGDDGDWEQVVPSTRSEDPAAPAVLREESRALRDCMGQLEVFERAVCWAHFVAGRSKREIARVVEMPESSLRVIFVKVLKALRGCLEAKGVA
jgi:RNA polymerase sigma factor (sigma-70 family)